MMLTLQAAVARQTRILFVVQSFLSLDAVWGYFSQTKKNVTESFTGIFADDTSEQTVVTLGIWSRQIILEETLVCVLIQVK